jgi:hypothetical protein
MMIEVSGFDFWVSISMKKAVKTLGESLYCGIYCSVFSAVLESRLSYPGLWHLFCGFSASFRIQAQNVVLVSPLPSVKPSTHTKLR